jgi:hypothetical protein
MDIGRCWRRLAPRRCCRVASASQGTDKVMKATPPLSLFDDGPGQGRSALLIGDQPHGDRCRATPSAWSAALEALTRLLP